MAEMAAAEASAFHKAAKREREEIEGNQHKRPRHSLLSESIFEKDIDTLDAIKDETVLYVMKSLEEEIDIAPKISSGKVEVGRLEDSHGSYEYLVSATDDELGIPRSPPAPLEEIDGHGVSQNFWTDLFEISSDQKDELLQPYLSHCYSINYRDFEIYSSHFPDSDDENWFVDEASTDSVLQDCLALF